MRRSLRHPQMIRPLALVISRFSLWQLVALYVAVTTAVAAVLAGALDLANGDSKTYGPSLRDSLSSVWAPGGDLLTERGQSAAYYVVAAVTTFGGVLFPIFLLGAFVFKLFQQDPLIWRRKISIESKRDGSSVLRFRFYNRVSSALVDTTTEVLARVQTSDWPRRITNFRMPVLESLDTAVHEKSTWSFGRSGVPFTTSVPLGQCDAANVAGSDFILLPGWDVPVEKWRVAFLLVARGVIVDSGTEFISRHEYRADQDIELGHYQEIETDYDKRPGRWGGWRSFDENCAIYVFGYGSLVSRDSVRRTLDWDTEVVYAHLQGWRRVWNVGSDQRSHPERTYLLDDGSVFDGVVAVLGLERDDNARCNGGVFQLRDDDLTYMDRRERNYTRVDVTDRIDWHGEKPTGNHVVYTYVPTEKAMQRLADARVVRRRAGYLETVYKGFNELAGPEAVSEFQETTVELTQAPWVSLTERIDPVLALQGLENSRKLRDHTGQSGLIPTVERDGA